MRNGCDQEGRRRTKKKGCDSWGWLGCGGCLTAVILITTLIFSILAYTAAKDVRHNNSPHCFKVYATGANEPLDEQGEPIGTMYGVLKVDEDKIDWKFDYRDFTTEPDQLHIHGPLTIHDSRDATAGIYVDLGDGYGSVEGAYGTQGTLTPKKAISVDEETAFAIMANPELFYVNVHNPTFVNGAARGTLGTRTKCDV